MKRFLIILSIILLQSSVSAFADEVCNRPVWKTVENPELHCKMAYNHMVLYDKAQNKSQLVIKRIKNNCSIVAGLWVTPGFNGSETYTKASDLNIDHIVPYHYIVEKVGCKKAKYYYYVLYNLEPVGSKYNKLKSDRIYCDKVHYNKEICEKQKAVCKKMQAEIANRFGDNLDCESM